MYTELIIFARCRLTPNSNCLLNELHFISILWWWRRYLVLLIIHASVMCAAVPLSDTEKEKIQTISNVWIQTSSDNVFGTALHEVIFCLCFLKFTVNIHVYRSGPLLFLAVAIAALGKSMSIGQLIHHFGPEGNILTINGQIFIHCPERMNSSVIFSMDVAERSWELYYIHDIIILAFCQVSFLCWSLSLCSHRPPVKYGQIPHEAVLIYTFFCFCCQTMEQVWNSDWNAGN